MRRGVAHRIRSTLLHPRPRIVIGSRRLVVASYSSGREGSSINDCRLWPCRYASVRRTRYHTGREVLSRLHRSVTPAWWMRHHPRWPVIRSLHTTRSFCHWLWCGHRNIRCLGSVANICSLGGHRNRPASHRGGYRSLCRQRDSLHRLGIGCLRWQCPSWPGSWLPDSRSDLVFRIAVQRPPRITL